ncbi:MAG: hydrogenase formation protein HypD [Desulfosalsimonadaceae bacterium]
MKHSEEYRDAGLSRQIIDRIKTVSRQPIRLMEVCGTHTVSIFRSGIRSVLPESITLLSGPGCPVCVTDQRDIDAFIHLAGLENTLIATFGDLMRVPGSGSSLLMAQTERRNIRMVYSTTDALELAVKNPDTNVIFLGVGFETTAPTIAASIISARQMNLKNYFVYPAHKLVPPALDALMHTDGVKIDGFLLPGHVSVIIGTDGYAAFFDKYHLPCAVAGFEPTDILQAILCLIMQIETDSPELANCYTRAVAAQGNPKARGIMDTVFETCDAAWRGIGVIPGSGLRIRDEYSAFDATKQFEIPVIKTTPPKGCRCGDILIGKITPPECPLFKTVCTPVDPVGPCMVSSEGTCAAYYKYN